MSMRRIASLRRLRKARLTQRNAEGGRLAEAENAMAAVRVSIQGARQAAMALDDGLAERCQGVIFANDLIGFEVERQAASETIAALVADLEQRQSVVVAARQAVADAELELRRSEQVLEKSLLERNQSVSREEQSNHDDLANARHFFDKERDS